MSTCKDCLHYDVCQALEEYNDIPKVHPKQCGCFKPKADVVEVKYGEWKEVNQTGRGSRHIQYTTKQCSICGYWNGRKKTNFCPNCGAKMKRKESEVQGE